MCSGEKPYACNNGECGKAFTTQYSLKTHMHRHERKAKEGSVSSQVCTHSLVHCHIHMHAHIHIYTLTVCFTTCTVPSQIFRCIRVVLSTIIKIIIMGFHFHFFTVTLPDVLRR